MKLKLLMILMLCSSFAFQAFSSAEQEQFLRVRQYLTERFPGQFSCELEGESLKTSLEKVPADAFLKGQPVKILMLFHKEWGSRVLLKGVSAPFEDRFSYIEKVFDFIFPFIQKERFEDFQKHYTLFDITPESFKLKKNKTQGSYLEIFLTPQGQPRMVKEMKGKQILLNIQIDYQNYKKYEMPVEVRVLFYEEKGTKRLKFRLMNFNDEPKISEDDFLG